FSWEPAYGDFLRDCGFADVFVVPLGLDDTLFKHPPLDDHIHPPTFVGCSMTYDAVREWGFVEKNVALKNTVDRAFQAGRVDRTHFAQGVHAVLGDTPIPLDEDALHHAERIFFIEGTRRLRQALVEALDLHVRGDGDWQAITARYGPPLDYHTELAAYYRNCPINLNTTSVQMVTTVNQRVFDCPAAGGFLLTDNQSHLQTLFDVEQEVVCYDTLEEAKEKMRWFLDHPKARREIIERAQKRIYGEHCYQHRLKTIAGHLKGIYGG
ncbi:MAG: glycosyltransferase, partial [Candidatus Hydrogenedentes bacterium]|nr:glycosyltransferase [Candidatus Hydrogenedentota bacterium]